MEVVVLLVDIIQHVRFAAIQAREESMRISWEENLERSRECGHTEVAQDDQKERILQLNALKAYKLQKRPRADVLCVLSGHVRVSGTPEANQLMRLTRDLQRV